MNKQKKLSFKQLRRKVYCKRIKKIFKKYKWFFIFSAIILTFPYIFSRPAPPFLAFLGFDFGKPNEVGDTFAGITAPFINLMAAFLVFWTLKAQIDANKKLNESNSKLLTISNKNNELTEIGNLKLLHENVLSKISAFYFITVEKENLLYQDTLGMREFIKKIDTVITTFLQSPGGTLHFEHLDNNFSEKRIADVLIDFQIIFKTLNRYGLVCERSSLFKKEDPYFMFYHSEMATMFNSQIYPLKKLINSLVGAVVEKEGKKNLIESKIKEVIVKCTPDPSFEKKQYEELFKTFESFNSEIDGINELLNGPPSTQKLSHPHP